MTDKLTLKLGDTLVNVEMDDNGRYSLNDVFKASGASMTKKPSEFLRNKRTNITVIDLREDRPITPYPENIDSYVVISGKGRGSRTTAPYKTTVAYLYFVGFSQDKDGSFMYTPKEKDRQEYLYLFKDTFGRHKIGISKDVAVRKNTIEKAAGLDLNILLSEHLKESCYEKEQLLHKHFKEYNTKGEWYDFSSMSGFSDNNLLEEIKSLIAQ